ncbi:MAG TPA: hypothetical protein VIO38_15985, partial [Rariglobus sp.]
IINARSVVGTGSITANGGAGSPGGITVVGPLFGGGGGGGGGGFVSIITNAFDPGVTVTANGGAGAIMTPTAPATANGSPGAPGAVSIYIV